MDTAANNGDKIKIDIQLVYQEIRHLTQTISEFISQQRACNNEEESRIRALEAGQVERKTQIETLKAEVDRLREKGEGDNMTSRVLAIVVAIVSGLVGVLVK